MSGRAVLWAAVSSRPQADMDSIPQQIADGRALADAKGWQVVDTLIVPGESRDYLDVAEVMEAMARRLHENERNPYVRLMELISGRAFDVLVIRERSRLGRSDALIAGIEGRCRRIGAVVWSMAMPPSGSEGGDLFVSAIERANAEYELVEFRRRHRRGMDSRAERGEIVAPRVPFGYRSERVQVGRRFVRRAVVAPAEAGAYREAVAQVVSREATVTDISRRLAVQFPDRSWSASSMSSILRNVFYAGVVLRRRCNDRGGPLVEVVRPSGLSIFDHSDWPEALALIEDRARRDSSRNKDSRGKQKGYLLAAGVHEALIDLPLWLELQREMESRTGSKRPYAVASLWGGMAVCGLCGSSMHYRYSTWQPERPGDVVYRYAYYRCARRAAPFNDCDNDIIHSDDLTAQVVRRLEALAASFGDRLDLTEDGGTAVDLLPGMEAQRADLLAQRGRLETLAVTGRISLDVFDSRAAEIDGALAALDARMARERATRAGRVRAAARMETLAEILPGLEGRLLAADPLEANRSLRELIERIEVARGEVVRIVWRD